nr:Hint domain-containing protein [Limobrevibacterium gyesilva]
MLTDHAALRAGALALNGLSTLSVDATATAEIGSSGGAAAGALTVDAGATLTAANGTVSGAIVNNGVIAAIGFGLSLTGTVSGSGVLQIGSFARLDLSYGSVGAGNTVTFLGAGGTLYTPLAGLPAVIAGLRAGNVINVGRSISDAVYAPTGPGFGTLTLRLNGAVVTVLTLAGAYAPAAFAVSGQAVTLAFDIACFVAGTRILTPLGEVRVEDLRSGDRVVTHSGRAQPVAWIGRRSLEPARHRHPEAATPVRVTRDAFAPGRPHRDLLLSPDHAVFVVQDAAPDALIPIRYLVNGATIRRDRWVGPVTYFHVELAEHGVLLADGLPAESYLDTGNRACFVNAPASAGPVRLHPDLAATTAQALEIWQRKACAPLVIDGPELAGIRQALLARARALRWQTGNDSGLRLLAGGEEVAPVFTGPRSVFRLARHPLHAAPVLRLVSRSTIPSEADPGHHDHRRLGIAVTRILVDGKPLPLDDAALGAGWHDLEGAGPDQAPLRWTDGDAALHCPGARQIDVTTLPILQYWRAPDPIPPADGTASPLVRYGPPIPASWAR